jgi:hypothetical protein
MVIFLVGTVVGAGLAVAAMFGAFKVQTKESWEADCQLGVAVRLRVYALVAENAQLRLSLAAREMTEEGKKVAAMTMAALDSVIGPAKEAINASAPNAVTAHEPALRLEDKP